MKPPYRYNENELYLLVPPQSTIFEKIVFPENFPKFKIILILLNSCNFFPNLDLFPQFFLLRNLTQKFRPLPIIRDGKYVFFEFASSGLFLRSVRAQPILIEKRCSSFLFSEIILEESQGRDCWGIEISPPLVRVGWKKTNKNLRDLKIPQKRQKIEKSKIRPR